MPRKPLTHRNDPNALWWVVWGVFPHATLPRGERGEASEAR